jgi:hypothetical protein
MGMADFGANALNWAKKIGSTVETVLDTAQPFIDLYSKGNEIAQQFKNKAKPPRSNSDATIVPGQVPTDAQLAATPPRAMSQSGGNLPLVAIGAGVVLLFLLKKK